MNLDQARPSTSYLNLPHHSNMADNNAAAGAAPGAATPGPQPPAAVFNPAPPAPAQARDAHPHVDKTWLATEAGHTM